MAEEARLDLEERMEAVSRDVRSGLSLMSVMVSHCSQFHNTQISTTAVELEFFVKLFVVFVERARASAPTATAGWQLFFSSWHWDPFICSAA